MSTSYTGELMNGPSDARAIIDLATAQADPYLFSAHPAAFVVPDGYRVEVIDPEQYQDRPNRKRGRVSFTDATSFTSYVDGHKDDGTTLWADAKSGTLIGVLDDHEPTTDKDGNPVFAAGWAQHRAVLALEFTDDWKLLTGRNEKVMAQAQFAEFVEDAAPCIKTPDAATMLEIAQSFKAHTNVRFESGKRVTNGETQLTYIEETSATAGRKGSLEVPETIVLGIAPWTSCVQAYQMEARLRWRINDGQLFMFYKLVRPDDVLRDAFQDVLISVQSDLDITAYHGTPRS